MSLNILIYGAGAIGRGFLGPLLQNYDITLSFVDNNSALVDLMKTRQVYTAAIAEERRYKFIEVPVSECFLLGDDVPIEKYDIVFSCVGPNNCYDLAEYFKRAKAVISCENDASTVIRLRELTSNENIYFGIPDVITSNTAPPELLDQDPLMTVTEQGILILERGNYQLPDAIAQVSREELNMHWFCKLFIHNAPHAIVAYLGWLKGYRYIHEAMADPCIEEVVVGSINEITDGIIGAGYATREFAEMYKQKELSRFRNTLLFDTIKRVAREPLRKLGKDNRISLGMRLSLFNRKIPKYTAIGAKAALVYDNSDDKEALYLQSLRESVGDCEVLRKYAGIELFDPLNSFIVNQDLSTFTNTREQGEKK
ncbi:MAG: hypothetical protein ACMUJM_17230 [bacterium]